MFCTIFKALRKESNLTQKQLGDILHLSQRAISHYESGHRFPDEKTLNSIADYFNVSTDYLLGRTDNRTLN